MINTFNATYRFPFSVIQRCYLERTKSSIQKMSFLGTLKLMIPMIISFYKRKDETPIKIPYNRSCTNKSISDTYGKR